MSSPAFIPQRLPRYLSQDELRRFFHVITDLRDRTLFWLIYHHGLRVGEVELLRGFDVDLVRVRIVVRRLKGGVSSEQPLFVKTAALLREYLDTDDAGAGEAPLFRGRVGPLRKRQIQSLFARYRDLSGLNHRFTCHGLRHSIATHLLDAGLPLEFVQDHLGHQDIRSTSIYARITDRHRAAVFARLETSEWIPQPNSNPPPQERSA